MTEHKNPLMNRGTSFRMEAGSVEAKMQLQRHCDDLNAMKGDQHWFLKRGDDGRHTIDSMPRNRTGQREPNCTPAEARHILRGYGLQGSAFAKSILSSLGEYSDMAQAAE